MSGVVQLGWQIFIVPDGGVAQRLVSVRHNEKTCLSQAALCMPVHQASKHLASPDDRLLTA